MQIEKRILPCKLRVTSSERYWDHIVGQDLARETMIENLLDYHGKWFLLVCMTMHWNGAFCQRDHVHLNMRFVGDSNPLPANTFSPWRSSPAAPKWDSLKIKINITPWWWKTTEETLTRENSTRKQQYKETENKINVGHGVLLDLWIQAEGHNLG